jgi:PAS domain S-box-containing protein
MPEITFIVLNNPYLNFPSSIIGWLVWFVYLGVILYWLYRWREYNQPWTRTRLLIFLVLLILVPISSVVLPGLKFSVPQALPVPDLPLEPEWPVILALATLPWMLAGFLLGPSSAAGLAVFSGLLIAAWSNHNPFLPLELAFLACIFSALVNQRFRTRVFRLLRHPLVSALILGIVFPLLALISIIFIVPGTIENRLDYAITLLKPASLAMVVNLFVGGLFAEVVFDFFPKLRDKDKLLQPSPSERSLETRFLFTVGPISLLLVLILMLTNWIVIDRTAKNMLHGRMANAARMTAESVPLFRSVGVSLIGRFSADERLLTQDVELVGDLLKENIRTIPYFRELFVLDSQGELVAFYVPIGSEPRDFSPDEIEGIELALKGVELQSFAIDPLNDTSAAQLSFMATLEDETGEVKGVLVGRSDLSKNPYAPSMLISLTSLEDMGGEGILIDQEGKILYHTNPARVMDKYTGKIVDEPAFFDDTAYDGTRQLVYFQPEGDLGWAVIITVPAQIAQQQALNIIGPLLILLAALILIGFLLIKYGLRFVTVSLHTLTAEANRMSEGTLDQPLQIEGEDEAGQLGRAFEKMRANLKARLDELNQLLAISRRVASSLDIEDSLLPVLEAALATGASSSRVILEPLMLVDIDEVMHSSFSYGAGPASDLYHYLDEQILSLSKKRERILLNNLSRARIFTFTPGFPRPQAIMAVALQHENMFFGTFWIGYDQAHQFSNEEQRYLDTLAGLAALAVGNAYLFQSAEVGRQRLDAIVASTPDPVLVTDYQNHLLLANPAAIDAFGKGIEQGKGQLIDEVISDQSLIHLMQSSREKIQSAEIVLPDEHIYLATSSSVVLEGKLMGRVCVLRDVTEFKKLDALKSEFVSTVSHDLRSPLTLIRGYATMLQMVGELNAQQTNYGQKIVASVESMSKLVNNLLDLGRIEAGVGLQLEMVPVYEILEKVVSELKLQAAQKHIHLDLMIPDQSIQLIEADQALLQQALHNLVENAIKFTEADGNVNVNFYSMEERIIFEVRDTGIGIAPADQQRIFEKFYRAARRGVHRDRGTGLGLTIVKSIAERHGGRVWLESQLGRGSVFFLEIPVSQSST